MSPLQRTPPDRPGTAEHDWQVWGTTFPEFDPAKRPHHLVVVAPHPDDETLGAGGLMATCRARGIPVLPVAVTDGEASHPRHPSWTPKVLAAQRIEETRRALATLGVTTTPIRLGLPDGAVTAHESALTAAIAGLLTDLGDGVWCATTWRRDGHPDHDATGRAAAAACASAGGRLLEFPLWMWHWAVPGDPTVPWTRARSVRLSPHCHRTKSAAIGHFRSQTESPPGDPDHPPVLGEHVLAHWRRTSETLFV
ncbi:PIG-L deacetylase family protein [Aldersonia kunmingensis]|uniref:PIG-L deacetylase family protein n=1 Tax=Aldersonia kunmingensis TaxID=408066 RepID=UPI001FE17747|nr:PIG-L family deacetylase [Aldersonia kunmingensis]